MGRDTSAMRPVLFTLLTAGAYFASARLGYALAIPNGVVTLWPPAGVTLGLLLRARNRDWPAIALGAMAGSVLSDLVSDYPIGLALAAACANVGESLVAAWLVSRWLGRPVELSSLRAVLSFTALGPLLANSVTACLGALMLHLGFGTPLEKAWLVWWIGDGLGMLIVAPAIIAWTAPILRRRRPRAFGIGEAAMLALTLTATAQIALGKRHGWAIEPGAYVTFPFLFWAAIRFGPLGGATCTLVVAIIATANASGGVGPFAATGGTLSTAMDVYTYLAVVSLSSLIVTAVLEERRLAQQSKSASEERTRFAMEASQVGIWDLDVATGVMPWSATLERLHGIAPGSFRRSFEAFLELVHPEDREPVRQEFERAGRERSDANLSYRTTWPDGSTHWLSGVGRSFYDDAGKPVRAAGIALDVTERRTLEEQYRQSQKMEAIGQLAGGVAHDFNNLLTVILGYANLLKESLAGNELAEVDLAEIEYAGQRASDLVRQLLAFSRKQVLDPRIVKLNPIVTSVDKMLRRVIGEDVDLVIYLAPDLGSVLADAGQIEQVLMNLAVNARDAMPQGGRLTIEAKNVDLDADYARTHTEVKPGPHVVISVSDTGIGMDAAVKARIFEPFFTTKEKGRGTGLGLSTVYGIVKQSGGHIWVYSEPGHGTTFRVYFPRVEGPQAPVAAPEQKTGSLRGSETILVAEDEAQLRRFMVGVLTDHGYRAITATNGAEAVAICQRDAGTIHLIVTDVVMPEMGGKQLVDAVSPERPGVRILFISGYAENAIVHHGRLDPGVELLSKPFNAVTFLRRVRAVLDRPRDGTAEGGVSSGSPAP
jgi:PAS domain S-box-containing protein